MQTKYYHQPNENTCHDSLRYWTSGQEISISDHNIYIFDIQWVIKPSSINMFEYI